jgi:DNA-binding IclR family transcriptional regulator
MPKSLSEAQPKETASEEVPVQQPRVDTTLFKGLNLLEALALSPNPQGVTQLSHQLQINKSNVHRLLRTRATAGFIEQLPDRSYRAGMKLWQLGNEIMQNLDLSSHSLDLMQELVDVSNESVHLAVLHDLEVIYVEKLDSDQPVRAYTRKGGSAPIHCVATGKTLLAFNYQHLRKPISKRLPQMTPNTITSIERLDAEVEKIRRTSLAYIFGVYREDVQGLAAPIFAPDGAAIAAIGISGPKSRLPRQRLEKMAPLVLQIAEKISSRIAGRLRRSAR